MIDRTAALVPAPDTLRRGEGFYTLTGDTTVAAAGGAERAAELLRELLGPATGLPLGPATDTGRGGIALALDAGLQAESYRLTVTADGVQLLGGDHRGLVWAIQTLRQLLPAEVFATTVVDGVAWEAASVEIEDAPRFSWRGLMLDVGRYYRPDAFLFRFVDLASMHKLNVLHLHLTEDQGWRFEVKRYPRLTEVGAWRRESQVGEYSEHRFDGTPHGGFYPQETLRRLVEYAGLRGVTVVPEIDMPGHMQAAIAAYPELGNYPGTQLEVATGWGIVKNVLNVEQSTVDFMCNVLDELIDVFPSEFIHVGGDECPKDQWRESDRARQRKRELGVPDENGLQSWFVRQLDAHLAGRGRRLIGWDEILEGGLAEGAAVMSWRGEEGGIKAAGSGHDVVMAPKQRTYFDYYQAEPISGEPLGVGRLITLADVFGYEPVPSVLGPGEVGHVLGTQGQLWTECLPKDDDVDYMAFPRSCALAEVAWGSPEREYDGFLRRLRTQLTRLDELDVRYRPLGD